jgi:hypothetical protein
MHRFQPVHRKSVAVRFAAFLVPALLSLTHCGWRGGDRVGTQASGLALTGPGVYTIADPSSFAIDGGYYWWSGSTSEQLYTLTSGNTFQQWQLSASGSGYTICNVGDGTTVCLSDGGSTLAVGVATDVWTVSPAGAGYTIQSQRTGMYIADAPTPGNGAVVPMSSSPGTWSLSGLAPAFRAGVYTVSDASSFAVDGGFFHWSGDTTEALYTLVAGNTFQEWQFAASGSGYTICNVGDGSGICLSDGGSNLDIGVGTDVWTITPSRSGYTLLNQRTGRYISDPPSPGNGVAVAVSTTATAWTLDSLSAADGGTEDGSS